MIHYWLSREHVRNHIYVPKYYDPELVNDVKSLSKTHDLPLVGQLIAQDWLSVGTGDEIGKLAYGTGDIPFVRTSDIANWEIKSSPKQGISEDIYQEYSESQNVQDGDILLVRDGTYLIGTNCIVTSLDRKILYQSHILKFRTTDRERLDPYLLFLSFNSDLVQRQIRSFQFTADTIDTIGNRYLDLTVPIPLDPLLKAELSQRVKKMLDERERGRAFIKQAPVLMEEALRKNSVKPVRDFLSKDWLDILDEIKQETVTNEFGHFETFWCRSGEIREQIYLPKYYDPEIAEELGALQKTCYCLSIGDLIRDKKLEVTTGDEIGKMAYGTGDIPFIRTSDFSNWELKHDPKQGVSAEIFGQFEKTQDVRPGDIFLVRDGTYLVGSSCIVNEAESRVLFCGGLYKLRVLDNSLLSPWLLLGLLNSYIVKRQIRTKQFTRDVIDTIGKRLFEVIVPVPRSQLVRQELSEQIQRVVLTRSTAKREISELARLISSPRGMHAGG